MATRRPGPPPESPEFGTFVSAPQSLLDAEDDPIFDSLDRAHTPLQPSGASKPIHVQLPPRPDEITPDYRPPAQRGVGHIGTSASANAGALAGTSPTRTPRRRMGSFNGGIPQSPPKFTQRRLSVRSPQCPAAINDSGRDIIFHPASASLLDMDDDSWIVHGDGTSEKVEPTQGQGTGRVGEGHGNGRGDGRGNGMAIPKNKAGESSTMSAASPRSPIQARLLDTLATTGKIASKWRQSIEHDFFDPPPPQTMASSGIGSNSTSSSTSTSATAPASLIPGFLPNVSHSSPFATVPQLAGSYVPPSGAPGFMPQEEPMRRDTAPVEAAIRLRGRNMDTQEVLDSALAGLLHRNLPPRQRLSSTWTLAYSSDQHGASLATLYRNIERRTSTAPTGSVIILTDAHGRLFGAFVNEPLRKREGQYYGTGESFLFKITPQRDSARIFRWTGKNQYFALCEGGFMSFGGGGTYGLLVDSTMSRGSSATCKTYDNEVLCRDEPMFTEKAVRFDCIALEVWMTS